MDRTNTKIVYDAIRSQFPPEYKKNAAGGSKMMHLHLS